MPLLRTVIAALTATVCLTSSAGAQSGTSPDADRSATYTVFGLIVDALPVELTAQLWRSDSRPWIITVPPDSGRVEWSAIAREIRRLMRARDTSAADTHRMIFRVESVEFRADSVAVAFYIGGVVRCPGVWMATGTGYAAAGRLGWGVPRGAARPMAHEDSFGCPGRVRPNDAW